MTGPGFPLLKEVVPTDPAQTYCPDTVSNFSNAVETATYDSLIVVQVVAKEPSGLL